MKNIFSLATTEFLSHIKHNNEFIGPLEQAIYRYIPLEEINILFADFAGYKNNLIKMIKEVSGDSDISKLAELTLSLCKPYLKYEVSISNTLLSPFKDSLVPIEPIKEFSEFVYSESFIYELKTFMILSYVYSQSRCKLPIKKNAINKLLHQKRPSKSEDEGNARPIYDKLFKIYALNQNDFYYLNSFLDYRGKDITFNSWYDIEIVLGLIDSAARSKNPFVPPKTGKSDPINIKRFLKAFQDININKHKQINILSCIDKTTIETYQLTENKIFIYNQFMLERIGNFNFINKLYNLQQKMSLSIENFPALFELANCPLLQFRLNFLEYCELQFNKYFKGNRLQLPEWNFFLYRIILHQIMCTLPIIDLVFHYLAYLATSLPQFRSFFQTSIDNYFDKLTENKLYELYQYSDETTFTPVPIQKFPPDIFNQNYTQLFIAVYNNLLYRSNSSFVQDFGKKLFDIYDGQQKTLIENLTHLPETKI